MCAALFSPAPSASLTSALRYFLVLNVCLYVFFFAVVLIVLSLFSFFLERVACLSVWSCSCAPQVCTYASLCGEGRGERGGCDMGVCVLATLTAEPFFSSILCSLVCLFVPHASVGEGEGFESATTPRMRSPAFRAVGGCIVALHLYGRPFLTVCCCVCACSRIKRRGTLQGRGCRVANSTPTPFLLPSAAFRFPFFFPYSGARMYVCTTHTRLCVCPVWRCRNPSLCVVVFCSSPCWHCALFLFRSLSPSPICVAAAAQLPARLLSPAALPTSILLFLTTCSVRLPQQRGLWV